jgi:hypothetical protein
MSVAPGDFLVVQRDAGAWDEFTEDLDRDRVGSLIERPEEGLPDLDAALALMDLVRDDLTRSGTGGTATLNDSEMRLAIRALTRTSTRAGFEFTLPFRDHEGWRGWWIRQGASHNYQARRDLLTDLFDRSYAAMIAAPSDAAGGFVSPRRFPIVRRRTSGARAEHRPAQTDLTIRSRKASHERP